MAGTLIFFKFQDNVSAIGDGNTYSITYGETLRVDIYGTATARTVQFYSINVNGEKIPLNGYNITTSALATSTSGTASETWIFDIVGLDKIQMRVSAISGGNLTVVGKVVA